MKLRNRKTGEIIEPCEIYGDVQDNICVRRPGENFGVYIDYKYNSLAELNADWEDVPEEQKGEKK